MKLKEVEKLISACEVDFEELKENIFRNPYGAKGDDSADINAMLINRIRLLREFHEIANQAAKLSPRLAILIHRKANEIEDELMMNWEEREIEK